MLIFKKKPEVDYLRHLIKNHSDASENIKKLSDEFFSLKDENQLREFAKKLGIDVNNLYLEHLKKNCV